MPKTKVTIKKPDFSKWQKAVNDLRVKTGLAIVENAVENAPSDIGNYKSQIEYDGANTVTAHAQYSADIEYGTGAHIITPVNHKFLKFRDKKTGKDVFRKIVHHPGTRPNPVMRNAAAKVQKEIPQIWKEVQRENGV